MRNSAPRLCRVAGKEQWHIYDARRRISTGCKSRAEAETVLAAYIAGEAKPKGVDCSISGILELYLADREAEKIPGLERLKYAHMPLKRHFGEKPVETIDQKTIRAYIKFRAEDVATGTIRTELQALRAALGWAAKHGIVAQAPLIALPPRPQPKDRWLTRDEADRLIANTKAHHIRLFVIVALHTAARKSAILELTWDRVSLERQVIDFRAEGHSRKRRVALPINATLLAALSEAKAGAETPYVIEYGGDRVADIKHGFHDACVRAGLADVTPHTLRHTAATWMAQSGINLWEVAGFLGHTNPQMVIEVYGHHHPDHLRAAAKALG